MGYDIIRCDFCKKDVMEGRNNWECECGAYCDSTTNYSWVKSKKSKESNSQKFNKFFLFERTHIII